MATTHHPHISVTCRLCKWVITAHQWWVLECHHIFDPMPQCWKIIKTFREWRQLQGKHNFCCCYFYINNQINLKTFFCWYRSGIWENCRAAYEDIVKHLERYIFIYVPSFTIYVGNLTVFRSEFEAFLFINVQITTSEIFFSFRLQNCYKQI